MREEDTDCRRLCDYQAELFEKSVAATKMSSEVFTRRYMNSNIAKELDSGAFLDDSKSVEDVFLELDLQYGPSSYGSVKYHRDIMYWVGYTYRYLCYRYEISSKQAYKMLPLKYVAGTYEAYHSLDLAQATERLLEAKGLSLAQQDYERKGLMILKNIRKKR